MSSWPGKKALVTGASGAIGAAVAGRLTDVGVQVAVSGRDRDRLGQVAAALGKRARPYPADLANLVEARALAGRVLVDLGELDLLIHGAGALELGEVETMGVDALDRLLAVNLRAPWILTRALLPGLVARRGQIAFVNSSVSARPGLAAYAASKHALRAFADSLRQEVNARGVRVISVYPGRTASAMTESLSRQLQEPYEPAEMLRPEDVAMALMAALEMPDSAEVTDVHLRPARPPGSRSDESEVKVREQP